MKVKVLRRAEEKLRVKSCLRFFWRQMIHPALPLNNSPAPHPPLAGLQAAPGWRGPRRSRL